MTPALPPLLDWVLHITLSCYALAMFISLFRLFLGPASQDRILAVDLIYNIGMLVILVLGIRYVSAMYFEAAMLIALFGFVSSTAMAKFLLRGEVIE